ncbi:arylamine N-acetyltransferase family protein [Nocardiopsis potens]|uniref:arylamine N-acetyltransferase family protein n=1 Tax=Nocardiopsis potens TaxID=1246458 RepID=UPI00034CFC6B|nr:arylamine N-acetyltransferase [Nocardiopsis potens]
MAAATAAGAQHTDVSDIPVPEVPPPGPEYGWQSEEFDLDAYLERIGYRGPREATWEVLREVNRAHARAIPFENLDVLLGREISLDIADLQDKMVVRRRGGYCHEQNVLFATALDRLGFRVTGLSARLLFGRGLDVLRTVGHTILKVEADGGAWIADTGVGGVGPLEPVPLADGAVSHQGDWTYRLDDTPRGWLLRYATAEGWFPLYYFSTAPFYRADYADHNYIASHHPRSPFHRMLTVQRNGLRERLVLTDRRLQTQTPSAAPADRHLDPEQIPQVLREVFGLHLPAEDERRLVRFVGSTPEGQELD